MKRIISWIVIIIVCIGVTLGVAYGLGFLQLPTATVDPTATDAITIAPNAAISNLAANAETVPAANTIIADAKVVPVLSADLSLPSSGIAVDIAIREGSVVTAGQRLVQLK